MHRKSPAKLWRKSKNVYRLVGNKSLSSGKEYYPPINYEEGNDKGFADIEMPPKAKLVTWSIVRVAPSGFENQLPYAVAIMEFDNGERVTGQIVDTDIHLLQKGDILYPTFRKMYEDGHDGIIHYGIKWSK